MSQRGVYRGIHSSMLDDPDFQRLSAVARHVLLTVRLCRDAGPAVIFRYYPEVLMRQTGLTRRRLDDALSELEAAAWVYREDVVVWVRNGLRHDPQVRMSSAKHRQAVIRQVQSLPKLYIVRRFCEYYEIEKAIEGLPEGYPQMASDTDTEVLPDTDTDSRAAAGPAANGLSRVAPVITAALDRSARLGAVPRLRAPEFWHAEAGAAGGTVDLAGEVLKAEAWLTANPRRAPHRDLPRFLHNWLQKAKEQQ